MVVDLASGGNGGGFFFFFFPAVVCGYKWIWLVATMVEAFFSPFLLFFFFFMEGGGGGGGAWVVSLWYGWWVLW